MVEILTEIKQILLSAKYMYKNSIFSKTNQKTLLRKVATGFSLPL